MAITPAGTRLQVATDVNFTSLVKNYDGTYATGITTVAGELPKGVTLYCRGAHKESSLGWSAWSAVVSFMVAAYQRWALLHSGSYASDIYSTAIDTSGNFYICGAYNAHPYVAKFTSAGVAVWQKYFDVSSSAFSDMCIDTAGNIYIAGYRNDASPQLPYLIKLTSAGSVVWVRRLDPASGFYFSGCTVDASGNIYTAGAIAYGGQPGSGGKWYLHVARWNSSGDVVWQRYFDSGDYTNATSLTADTAGNIYVVGGGQVGGSGSMGVLIKMTIDGALVWAKRWTTYRMGAFSEVVVKNNSEIYTVAYINSTWSAGYSWRPHITRWNSDGTVVWQKEFPTDGCFNGVDICADGTICAVGYQMVGDYYQPLITKFDPDGTYLWGQRLMHTNWGILRRVVATPTGNLFVGGVINYRMFMITAIPSGLPSGPLPQLTSINVETAYPAIDSTLTFSNAGWAMYPAGQAKVVDGISLSALTESFTRSGF